MTMTSSRRRWTKRFVVQWDEGNEIWFDACFFAFEKLQDAQKAAHLGREKYRIIERWERPAPDG